MNGTVLSHCATNLQDWCVEGARNVWRAGQWSACQALPWMGNLTHGKQTRSVSCGCYDFCDPGSKPSEEQECPLCPCSTLPDQSSVMM